MKALNKVSLSVILTAAIIIAATFSTVGADTAGNSNTKPALETEVVSKSAGSGIFFPK